MSSGRLLKFEGAGNDFLLGVGGWAERLAEDVELVAALCRRRVGIGADGVLALFAESPTRLRLVYRNADGSLGAFCANGTRCAARAGVELLGLEAEHVVVTSWAEVTAMVDGASVSLDLPSPAAEPATLDLETDTGTYQGSFVKLGVPHLVVRTQGLAALDLPAIGPTLRHHPGVGEEGANVSFVEAEADGCLAIRTWERGVEGETLSCGSATVVAALVSMAERRVQRLELRPRSGDLLMVEALGEPPLCATRLTGPTRLVAEILPCQMNQRAANARQIPE